MLVRPSTPSALIAFPTLFRLLLNASSPGATSTFPPAPPPVPLPVLRSFPLSGVTAPPVDCAIADVCVCPIFFTGNPAPTVDVAPLPFRSAN